MIIIVEIDNVISDCKVMLSQMQNTRMSSIRRTTNDATHSFCVGNDLGSHVRIECVPAQIYPILYDDLLSDHE